MQQALVAPNAFKGTLTAQAVASHVAGGLKAAMPGLAIRTLPLADGGDGTIEAFRAALGGKDVAIEVAGPFADRVRTSLLVLAGGAAVIEIARTSGLAMLRGRPLDPMHATTRGAGEAMIAAMASGASELLVGSGGSATVDGGTGALKAFGFRFLDSSGRDVEEGGAGMCRVARIEAPDRHSILPPWVRIRVLCDVRNPLTGPLGAARVFGPQKGATRDQVLQLEDGLAALASTASELFGRDAASQPGAGSAGGFAWSLSQFLGAELESGAEAVMRAVGFNRLADESDLVVTGEGAIDAQSVMGKVVSAVGRACAGLLVPCVAVAGRLGQGWEAVKTAGVSAVYQCFEGDAGSIEVLKARTPSRLSDAGARIARDHLKPPCAS